MGLNRVKSNNIKNPWLAVLFGLLPGLAFSATSASNRDFEDERWFEVELIVFAHLNKDALESEDWPGITSVGLPEKLVELSFPDPKKAIRNKKARLARQQAKTSDPGDPSAGDDSAPGEAIVEPIPMPVAFEMLPEDELQLKEATRRLANSRQFKPLIHVAWRQPTFDRKRAQTVLIYDGMTKSAPKIKADSLPETGPLSPNVIGTVQLSVARYLHLAADLAYRTPVTERVAVPLPDLVLWYDRPYPTLAQHQGPAYRLEEWSAIQGFQLKESRRMRSGKTHYLDNPFFGIVVLVTPVELPRDPEEESAPNPLRNISAPGT